MIPIFPVVTITSEIPDRANRYREFHFKNEERKDSFVRTLYAHRLSIGFSATEENLTPTRDLLIELDTDPIEYALKVKAWAKDTLDHYYAEHLTEDELAYVRRLA